MNTIFGRVWNAKSGALVGTALGLSSAAMGYVFDEQIRAYSAQFLLQAGLAGTAALAVAFCAGGHFYQKFMSKYI